MKIPLRIKGLGQAANLLEIEHMGAAAVKCLIRKGILQISVMITRRKQIKAIAASFPFHRQHNHRR